MASWPLGDLYTTLPDTHSLTPHDDVKDDIPTFTPGSPPFAIAIAHHTSSYTPPLQAHYTSYGDQRQTATPSLQPRKHVHCNGLLPLSLLPLLPATCFDTPSPTLPPFLVYNGPDRCNFRTIPFQDHPPPTFHLVLITRTLASPPQSSFKINISIRQITLPTPKHRYTLLLPSL